MVDPFRHDDVSERLRSAYDGSATERDESVKSPWKLAEREAFLERLRAQCKKRLIEIGAGTGHDSRFFNDRGISVVATDISSEMVRRCRAKGVEAHVMDCLHMELPPRSFDAAYAFNSLLHVPNADLPQALDSIRKVLTPGALFYLGVYGGDSFEGVLPGDWHDPPRFFSFRSDSQIRAFIEPWFELLDFHVVTDEDRFQSLTLRVAEAD